MRFLIYALNNNKKKKKTINNNNNNRHRWNRARMKNYTLIYHARNRLVGSLDRDAHNAQYAIWKLHAAKRTIKTI